MDYSSSLQEGLLTVSSSEKASITVNRINARTTSVLFRFLTPDAASRTRQVELSFSFPAIDIAGIWHPSCRMDRDVRADWSGSIESQMSISAPVYCCYTASGTNVRTFAVSETKQRVTILCGFREENSRMVCRITAEIPRDTHPEEYEIKLWQMTNSVPFSMAIDEARIFLEEAGHIVPLRTPDTARLPLYSFWYSYHQNVDAASVEEESRKAAEMGFSVIIVDDGWQTEDNHRGYAYCGDWQPCASKFPDMADHVKRVQAMGLQYMMWFSVPFVGINAACYDRFKDKFLYYLEDVSAGVLDPRYPEVREYLKSIYIHAVRDWGLDGLKLDFIDLFTLRPDSPSYNERMDTADVQEGLYKLLSETKEALLPIRPNLLIEFRQRYIGPEIRQFGNMLRVGDCPGASLANRVGTIDLRLLSGTTAVHSDMLVFHDAETPENAALQIVSCLFSTVQISVRLGELRENLRQMLMFWLTFLKEHRALLQEGTFLPSGPQNLYPSVTVRNETSELLIHYAENHYVSLADRAPAFCYINAGGSAETLLEGSSAPISCTVYDCCGRIVSTATVPANAFIKVTIPQCGLLIADQAAET